MIGFRNSVEETPPPDASADQQALTPSAQSVNWQAARAGDPRAPGAAPVAATGAVSIPLPFQVEIYEDDRFIGLNAGAGIRLRPGSHRLTLVNESLGYRATQTVNVSSGRTTTLTPSLPTGMLQLNATPWAEVLLDGKSLGETPLANVPVSIGQHTLVFRHPELGQQSRSAIVTAQSSTRVTVDLQKQ